VRAGKDGRLSTQASFGLAGMGPAAAERIFAALHDPDENIRVHAAITIGRMQPAKPPAVTVPLIGALGDGSQRVRYFVVQDLAALVRAGNTDVSILEALERARSDPDRYVQETAERVLREHRPTPPRP